MANKELSPASAAISEDLQKALADTGTTGSEIYYDHGQKAGHSKETIDGVKNYDRTFGAGLIDASAKIGLKAHVANAEIGTQSFTAGGAKGEEFTATYTGQKSGTIPARGDEPAKEYTSFGGVRLSHKTTTSGKGGDIGVAINFAQEAAAAALAPSK